MSALSLVVNYGDNPKCRSGKGAAASLARSLARCRGVTKVGLALDRSLFIRLLVVLVATAMLVVVVVVVVAGR